MRQKTLKRTYHFGGKGLHTGKKADVSILPAGENSGIVFRRTDLGVDIPALAEYVSSTVRSTTLTLGEASVATIEHIMSALTGMGVDNAVIEVDNEEMPILDGSARLYVEAFAKDGLVEQDAERKYLTIDRVLEEKDEKSGSWVRISPADSFSIDAEVDFGSKVLGVQKVHWDETVDYAGQIGICRTFCFYHELEYLAGMGLVKGGDMNNAIVVVENPVSREQVHRMTQFFGQPDLEVRPDGYLNNLELHFKDECGRHKLLDLIGDIRLSGGYLKAHIEAFKPGHGINTSAAALVEKNSK